MPIPRVIHGVIEAPADAAPRAHDDLRAVLDAAARVLAAADVFHALGEPHPQRPAREPLSAADMATPTIAGRGGVARRVSFPASTPGLGWG